MAQHTASIGIEHRRTWGWAFCVGVVLLANALSVRLPRGFILFFARRPMQYRIGGGRWQTVTLENTELYRRFG